MQFTAPAAGGPLHRVRTNLKRHRTALSIGGGFAALTAWAWADAGGAVVAVVLVAGIGMFAVIAVIALGAGFSAAHHAKSEARAIARIEAQRRRQVTR